MHCDWYVAQCLLCCIERGKPIALLLVSSEVLATSTYFYFATFVALLLLPAVYCGRKW
jgi:hypothetical protein